LVARDSTPDHHPAGDFLALADTARSAGYQKRRSPKGPPFLCVGRLLLSFPPTVLFQAHCFIVAATLRHHIFVRCAEPWAAFVKPMDIELEPAKAANVVSVEMRDWRRVMLLMFWMPFIVTSALLQPRVPAKKPVKRDED